MSSFKRRAPTTTIPGTRPSPYNSLPLLSTGLTSLDDLLGGGLPLSSSLLIDSDTPTQYAELLLKFYVAQGVECKQDVVVVGCGLEGGAGGIVKSLMGLEGGPSTAVEGEDSDEEDSTDAPKGDEDKLKIAFRYEGMKKHAVTVEAPVASKSQTDVYCSQFDLTTIMPLRASDNARIHLIDVDTLMENSNALPADLYEILFEKLSLLISGGGYSLPQDPTRPRKAMRIAISALGSPSWGSTSSPALYLFLHRLRHLLRQSSATLFTTFPSHLYAPHILPRLSHSVDTLLSLTSFSSSPIALSQFPRHNGLIKIPKLPCLNSLVPGGVKLSVLRGLGGGNEGGGVDLGFRVKRRRFLIETVGGDEPYGGTNEGDTKKKVEKKVVVLDKTDSIQKENMVRFAGEEVASKKPIVKKVSVSSIIHKQPELYEF